MCLRDEDHKCYLTESFQFWCTECVDDWFKCILDNDEYCDTEEED